MGNKGLLETTAKTQVLNLIKRTHLVNANTEKRFPYNLVTQLLSYRPDNRLMPRPSSISPVSPLCHKVHVEKNASLEFCPLDVLRKTKPD